MGVEAKVDANASLGDVVQVEIGLWGKGSSLSIGVLDHAYSTEREEGLLWIRIEFRFSLVEQDVWDGG